MLHPQEEEGNRGPLHVPQGWLSPIAGGLERQGSAGRCLRCYRGGRRQAKNSDSRQRSSAMKKISQNALLLGSFQR